MNIRVYMVLIALVSLFLSCAPTCHISGEICLESMKDVQYAKLYHPYGGLVASTPIKDGHFTFSLKRDRYDVLKICFGSERSNCYAEDFTAPYVVPDVDSIKTIIGKTNEISGSLSSRDYDLMKCELEYVDSFRDPFDQEAYERSRIGKVELLSYIYLQHLDDRVGLDALMYMMSYSSLSVKDFISLYDAGSRRLRCLLKKRIAKCVDGIGSACWEQEANAGYLENGYNAASKLIEKYSLAPSLEDKRYVVFLSESAWLIAIKQDDNYEIFYGLFKCDAFLSRIIVPSDCHYRGIESLFNISMKNAYRGYQDGTFSRFCFYCLSVSQNHSDAFQFNSNMNVVVPLEAMIVLYHCFCSDLHVATWM